MNRVNFFDRVANQILEELSVNDSSSFEENVDKFLNDIEFQNFILRKNFLQPLPSVVTASVLSTIIINCNKYKV
ncbi:hypothetical protein [Fluviispira sanaruensis]|uniref:Uncharacterized protein n=1 Tax=Fluviispira sanaruensis TaxID=2493639 RepID=A0A4P2VNR9_FLUSA|nr:hypothetical protein [Fluviispira sanaruensis]BBH54721.1 hypothetical protein JCM31447_31950 [Fluviispira sanaruensis]